MNSNLQSILEALYEIDPSLKAKEGELLKLLEKIDQAKPDLKIDHTFAAELREKLTTPTSSPQLINKPESSLNNWFKKILYPLGGGLVTVGLLIAIVISEDQILESTPQHVDGIQITYLSNNAFGPLGSSTAYQDLAVMPEALPMALAGEGDVLEVESVKSETVSQLIEANAESLLPMSEPTGLEPVFLSYNYEGDPLNLGESVEVYKRINVPTPTPVFSNLVSSLGFDLANLGTFESLEVEEVRLNQAKNGYVINVDFRESRIDIYSNQNHWVMPEISESSEVKSLSDKSVISIATNFLEKHELKRDWYGEPVIENPWILEEAFNSEATVIYPLIIEGNSIFDESGSPQGMAVTVNMEDRQVVSVRDLRIEQFERSTYPAIAQWSDVELFLSELSEIPIFPPVLEGFEGGETLELGEPEVVLMRAINEFELKTDQNPDELFTPALKFPILNLEDHVFMRNHVLIPLAEDIFEARMTEMEDQIRWSRDSESIEKATESTPIPEPGGPVILEAVPGPNPDEDKPILTDEGIYSSPVADSDEDDSLPAVDPSEEMMADPPSQ